MRLPINLFAIAILSPTIALALPSDREAPINIEADHAQLDDREGITQYKGNVILTQGSLRITGNIITFFHDKNKQLVKAVAEGKRSTYQQVNKPGENPIKAKALKMEYYAGEEKIYLIGDGYIWQNGNEFNSNYIEYDIARNIVNANSKPVTVDGETQKKERVHIIIQPKNMFKPSTSNDNSALPTQVENKVAATPENNDDQQNDRQTIPELKTYPTAITSSRLNVRSGPGTQYQKLGTFEESIEVIVLTRQTDWAQVRGTIDGEVVIGWVSSEYLK